ncbi:MAG: hypothetical protein ABIR47_14490 [Candidatus Kapaibacterium sp.]
MKLYGRVLGISLGILFCLPSLRAEGISGRRYTIFSRDIPISRLTDTGRISSARAKQMIAERAAAVISALKSGNTSRLASFVSPTQGLRFSPYVSMDSTRDLVFQKSQLAKLSAGARRYSWGTFDGPEESPRLTFRQYYRRFIYDHDYSRAKRRGYNDEFLGHSTIPNNIPEFYPNGIAVEYNFPGFNPKFDGMDWKSLWLVFEQEGGTWYLVAIAHDEWSS